MSVWYGVSNVLILLYVTLANVWYDPLSWLLLFSILVAAVTSNMLFKELRMRGYLLDES